MDFVVTVVVSILRFAIAPFRLMILDVNVLSDRSIFGCLNQQLDSHDADLSAPDKEREHVAIERQVELGT
jgi:hypothetical protein